MKLGTMECIKALREYPVKNNLEKLATIVLIVDADQVAYIPGIMEMSDANMDKLALVIETIRKELDIVEEA